MTTPDDESRLNELIGRIQSSHCSDTDLLIEHLQLATAFHIGAMNAEYRLNLRLALESAHRLSDPHLRATVEQNIDALLTHHPSHHK